MKTKPFIKQAAIVVDSYGVMQDAVEYGVRYGWNRAHKHTSTPGEDALKDEIEQAVMNAICEKFKFPQVEE